MESIIPLDDIIHHLTSPAPSSNLNIDRKKLFFVLILNIFFFQIFFPSILPFFWVRAANQQVMKNNAYCDSIDDLFQADCTANDIAYPTKARKTIFEQPNAMLNLDSCFG
jgi:hypothetical protein